MRTTIVKLRRLIRECIKESWWGEEDDAKIEKYRALKRAEEERPWEPSTRVGKSSTPHTHAQPEGSASGWSKLTHIDSHEADRLAKHGMASHMITRQLGSRIKFYTDPHGNVYVHDAKNDLWYGWNYDQWVAWADPR